MADVKAPPRLRVWVCPTDGVQWMGEPHDDGEPVLCRLCTANLEPVEYAPVMASYFRRNPSPASPRLREAAQQLTKLTEARGFSGVTHLPVPAVWLEELAAALKA